MTTIITVQGEFSATYPAERAIVTLGVQADGPERDEVFSDALAASDAVRSATESLVDKHAGPITAWSSESLRVWSERPWNNEGKQLAPVFHASVDFSVTFKDFEVLARWIESVAAIDLVTVSTVSWDLTKTTRSSATSEVRSRAVKDAVTKATIYAQSIGLTSVQATALADPGMLGDPSGGAVPSAVFAKSAMMARGYDSAAPQLALRPEEITVAAAVDARFVAS